VYAGGAGELERLDGRIDSLEKQLREWKQTADADKDFIAEREKELAATKTERAEKAKTGGVSAPAQGSWFASALVPIKQKLPSDEKVRAEMKQLDRVVGEENRKRDCAKGPPPPSEPHTVGMSKCGDGGCHPQAVAFWKQTVHAHAWKTLVDDGRQFHNECFSCHVTPGATLCKPEPFTDVQCEVCHGPASIHVARGGEEEPISVTKKPDTRICAEQCHTPQHSDTFQLEAYLRDILGDGHGKKRREQLGAGPTGHELRQAALKKAGRAP
jgi:Cytochrome c554 and c-prime